MLAQARAVSYKTHVTLDTPLLMTLLRAEQLSAILDIRGTYEKTN